MSRSQGHHHGRTRKWPRAGTTVWWTSVELARPRKTTPGEAHERAWDPIHDELHWRLMSCSSCSAWPWLVKFKKAKRVLSQWPARNSKEGRLSRNVWEKQQIWNASINIIRHDNSIELSKKNCNRLRSIVKNEFSTIWSPTWVLVFCSAGYPQQMNVAMVRIGWMYAKCTFSRAQREAARREDWERKEEFLALFWRRIVLLKTERIEGRVWSCSAPLMQQYTYVREVTREGLREWSESVKTIKIAVKLRGYMSLRVLGSGKNSVVVVGEERAWHVSPEGVFVLRCEEKAMREREGGSLCDCSSQKDSEEK